MLKRSYCDKYKIKYPTYKYCIVYEGWYLFSNFKKWMEQQDWEGKQLDKDLLVRGNKVYSPETCLFVSAQVNKFLLESDANRGEYMIGCYWDKQHSKFTAVCMNPFTKLRERVGFFGEELEAHQAWLKRKLEHAYTLAALQTDERVAKALIDRYTNYTIDTK